jgi:uncharacterized membrane protein
VISPERRRNWAVVTTLGVCIGVVVVIYPFALEAVLGRLGVRASALALLGLALATLLFSRAGLARSGGGAAWGLPLLLALAAGSGDARWLRLVPALVYATLASVFATSLRAEDSLIEKAARWLTPQVPGFVRPYCRGLTAVWAGVFAVSALAIAVVAGTGTGEQWRTWAGGGLYGVMLGIAGCEFFVRKTYFRNYFHMGAFDRLWSRVFPARNTAMGRQSEAYIRRFRESGGDAPARPGAGLRTSRAAPRRATPAAGE